MKRRTAILISGRGSNMEALIAAARDPAFPAQIDLVVSNRPDAAGLAIAERHSVRTETIDHRDYGADRGAHETAIDTVLRAAEIEIVCLAGYMRLLTPVLVQAWQDRMLNIHPSLLPSFPGLHTHARALAAGVKLHGCTVHLVTQEMDAGPILGQAAVPVLPGDTEQDLAQRVLRQEHVIYPAALAAFAASLTPGLPEPTSWLANPLPWRDAGAGGYDFAVRRANASRLVNHSLPESSANIVRTLARPIMNLPTLTPPSFGTLQNFFFPMFWGCSDPQTVTNLAQALVERVLPAFHFADNILTWGRNNSMLEDARFVEAWQTNAETDADFAIVWRRYVLACAGYHAIHLDGDFVECGCYRGVGIKTVVDYLGGTDFPRTFWGYDIFEHTAGMEHHSMPGLGDGLAAEIRTKFAAYPRVNIVQGEIPAVLASHCPERITYLHIDLNEATAEIAALEVLFDRIVPGGIVILDDYEWAMAYRRQKLTEDPWFESRGYRVMPLPTGQGLVIKR